MNLKQRLKPIVINIVTIALAMAEGLNKHGAPAPQS